MNWLYNEKEVTDISQFPPNTFGFVYQITTPDGKKYIGNMPTQLKRRLKKIGSIPSEVYGLTDDFGKLTALQAEIKSYQKALNLTDDEAFD